MRVYKLMASAIAATAGNMASLQILRPGRIRSVQVAMRVDSITDNAAIDFELSFGPTVNTSNTNVAGPILQVSWQSNFVTSGLGQSGVNTPVPMDCPVAAADMLYINGTVVGTVSAQVAFFIWVEEGTR